jgi:transposase
MFRVILATLAHLDQQIEALDQEIRSEHARKTLRAGS